MEAYFQSILEQLSIVDFWETKAHIYIYMIVSFLVALPILNGISILFAINRKFKLHQFTQFLLFILTLIALAFMAYILYYIKGFEPLIQDAKINSSIVMTVLISQIVISISTLLLWMFALIHAVSDKKRRALPGLYSQSHAQAGKQVLTGIFLTALSSVGVYWMLFLA